MRRVLQTPDSTPSDFGACARMHADTWGPHGGSESPPPPPYGQKKLPNLESAYRVDNMVDTGGDGGRFPFLGRGACRVVGGRAGGALAAHLCCAELNLLFVQKSLKEFFIILIK